MQLDAAELGAVGSLVLLVGTGRTVAVAKGQVLARFVRIHGVEDLLLVPHKAVQLVLHCPGGLPAGQGLGSGVGQQIQHARRLRTGKAPARIPGQAEQIQQHLAVQPAVDLLQVQLFAAGLVVHHPHPVGAVVLDPLVRAVHRTHQLHRAPVRQAVHLPGHGILAPAYFQLTGHGLKLGLVLLVPQVAQQTGHALFQPGEQIGKACGILRQIAPRVLVHQRSSKVGHGGIIQF